MTNWQEDILDLMAISPNSVAQVFARLQKAAHALEFDFLAYGHQSPYPVSRPEVHWISNYPQAWQQRYEAAGYLQTDPSIAHGRQKTVPAVWSDALFAATPQLWEEAQEHGLRVGWFQSCFDAQAAGSMLTFARRSQVLSRKELLHKEQRMRWLVQVAHLVCARIWAHEASDGLALTARELEVLKWSADGKSAQDIADILLVSKSTVDFHIKNSVLKLQVSNKTAAVARAALMGWLN